MRPSALEQLRRVARWPGLFAPGLGQLHSPPPDPAAPADTLADFDLTRRDHDGHLTAARMSARAFVAFADRLPRLRWVALIGAAPLWDEVVASEALPRLDTLILRHNPIADADLGRLDGRARLRHLDLSHTLVTRAGLGDLARSECAASLQSLIVGTAEYDGLLDDFGRVTSFDLTGSMANVDFAGRRFDTLELARCRLGERPWTPPDGVVRLGLAANALGDASVARLAGSGVLSGVTSLDLRVNRLTAASLGELAGRVPELEWLGLTGNFLSTGDCEVLLDRDKFPSLRRVERPH